MKEKYEKPCLKVHGDIGDITKGMVGPQSDGTSGMPDS